MAARWNRSMRTREPYAASASSRRFGATRIGLALPGATRIARVRLGGVFGGDVLRHATAHRMPDKRHRSVDGREGDANIRCVPFDIVPLDRAIRESATAKIQQVHGRGGEIDMVDDVVPHAPRTNPAVREQHVPRARTAPLEAETYVAVVDKPKPGVLHLASKLRHIVPPRLLVYLGLLYVVACWGLNVVLVKSAIADARPAGVHGAALSSAMTPLAFALVYASGERIRIDGATSAADRSARPSAYGIYQYLWIVGLANTSAFASSLLGATAPIFTLAFVAIAGHERVRSVRWIGPAIALLGHRRLRRRFCRSRHVSDRRRADRCFRRSSSPRYNVSTARLLDRYSPIVLVAITMTIGMLMILPVGIPALCCTATSRIWAGRSGARSLRGHLPDRAHVAGLELRHREDRRRARRPLRLLRPDRRRFCQHLRSSARGSNRINSWARRSASPA